MHREQPACTIRVDERFYTRYCRQFCNREGSPTTVLFLELLERATTTVVFIRNNTKVHHVDIKDLVDPVNYSQYPIANIFETTIKTEYAVGGAHEMDV